MFGASTGAKFGNPGNVGAVETADDVTNKFIIVGLGALVGFQSAHVRM
jgi:hypothetical protein